MQLKKQFNILNREKQFYEGPSLVIHRLKRMQYVADIFFVLSGISMVDTVYAFLRRWFENYVNIRLSK